MTRITPFPPVATIALVLIIGFPPSPGHAEEKSKPKLDSPRATVRTLLTAITVARANPNVIQDAAACLDLGGRPGDQAQADLLATQLEAVLRSRDVDTELIPEKVAGDVYVLPDAHGARIALKRRADGRWLFDAETVAQISTLYTQAQKHLQDKNKEAATLSVSPDFASARATVRTLVTSYRRLDFTRILKCLDLSDVPAAARDEVGRQLANRLKQIIYRQRRIILQELPDSNYADPYTLLSRPDGVVELARVPSGDRKGEWVFTRETVGSIDPLYVAFEDQPYSEEIVAAGATGYLPHLAIDPELWLQTRLPGWLRAAVVSTRRFRIEIYQLVGFVVVPVLAFGVYRLATSLLTACVVGLLGRRGTALPRETVRKRLTPTARLAGVLFLRWGLLLLGMDRALLVPLLVLLNPLIWLLAMWAAFRLIDLVSDLIEVHLTAGKRRPDISQMLWPVGSLAIKIGLFVLTMFHLMTVFAWDVTAVLTGLGIGGLAFALGAQDSLKNLFGSFTLIADRPFVVGESVKIGNHDVGVVEVVGLRSTRIRTADDTLLIVPNSSLTNMEITNFGRRRFRRYSTKIGVAYSTTLSQLSAFREGIKDIIRRLERTRKDHFEVAVNDLGASAVEVLVSVYFDVADWHEELEARDALILEILRLADDLGVELAYPTQTIHLAPSPRSVGGDGEQERLTPAEPPLRG
jgi:MscS family membrane protein